MALECRHVLATRGFFAPVIQPATQSAAEPPRRSRLQPPQPASVPSAASIALRRGGTGFGDDRKGKGKEIGRTGGRHQGLPDGQNPVVGSGLVPSK